MGRGGEEGEGRVSVGAVDVVAARVSFVTFCGVKNKKVGFHHGIERNF